MENKIAEEVTAKIVAAMEAGKVPWRKPWNSGVNIPTSLSTGKEYSGVNWILLSIIAELEEYKTNLWGTFLQFKSMGGSVNKGEKATQIIYWKKIEKIDNNGDEKSFMVMRQFHVFNIEQTNVEVPDKYKVDRTPVPVLDGLNRAINYENGPLIQHLPQDRAFYNWEEDAITLPLLDTFKSSNDYAQTLLHELAHSTGHEKRLNRDLKNSFGCDKYAEEELIAEIGQAMLATALDIEVDWSNSAAYLNNWLKVLKGDPQMVITAARKAQRIVDHILVKEDAELVAA